MDRRAKGMGKSFVHPKTKQVFTLLEDGSIEVQDPAGISGVFKRDGSWVSGELRFAEPVMLDFVGGTYRPTAASK
jgi:hypothetical protein